MIKKEDQGNNRGTSYPRSIVLLDGHYTFFLDWTVNLNSTHQGDDFSINLPFLTTNHAPETYLVSSGDNASLLFTKSDVKVEVYVGFPKDPNRYTQDDLVRIMYGYIDQAELSFDEREEKITLTGRSMIAPFLDNKTTDKYQNMVSSAIAEMLAEKYGLDTQITQTYALAGQYYDGDHVNLTTDMTEWDLLTFLAEQEGFALRVFDNTLYFGPFSDLFAAASSSPIPYTWGQNIENLTITRYPHAAKNITIEVHSWDAVQKQHVKAVAKATRAKATSTYTQRYYQSGMNTDQAQQFAQSKLDELSRLELVGQLTTSGNELLTLDRSITLLGVGITLSQDYFIRQAQHTFTNTDQPKYEAQITFSNLLLQDEDTGGI